MKSLIVAMSGIAVVLAASCAETPSVLVEPLRLVYVAPGHGSVCVGRDVQAMAVFSQDIDVDGLGEAVELRNAAGVVAASVDYDKSALTLTLTPQDVLDWGTLYSFILSQDVKSASSGHLVADIVSSFETVRQAGCAETPECQLPSDCTEGMLCSSIGTCIEECVTERDCPGGVECVDGACAQ